RAGDPELAGVGARAADGVGDLVGAGVAELQVAQRPPHLIHRSVAHPAQDDVLVHGRAGIAAGVAANYLGKTAQLIGGQVAAADLDLDSAKALLALGGDV